MVGRLLYKWRQSRKVYTQAELTAKLTEYRDWLMARTNADFEHMRIKLLKQETIINELKASESTAKGAKAVQRKRKPRARKRA